jgi:hypothetical protein
MRMSIKKISLLSVTFITILALNHTMMAMETETIKQSITNQLSALDTVIIYTSNQLKLAKEQKKSDKKKYSLYKAQWKEMDDDSWEWSAGSSRNDIAKHPEVCAYRGDFDYFDSNNKPFYRNNGSKNKYLTEKQHLINHEVKYNLFTTRIERYKRQNDNNYLVEIEEQIKKYNVKNKIYIAEQIR